MSHLIQFVVVAILIRCVRVGLSLNVIGEHLWQLKNDPKWREDVEEALPILEVMKKDTLSELSSEDKAALEHLIFKAKAVKKPISLKQQKKLTRQILKQLPDWEEWKQSKFKQLDQYHDQDTFGEPEPRPKGANLLSLLWCYLVKDDGPKKAQCVCNENKNRRGTVTLAETYAASLKQTVLRVFWTATAITSSQLVPTPLMHSQKRLHRLPCYMCMRMSNLEHGTLIIPRIL